MIDIHSHILHNVDDGAKDFEEAIEMARIAESDGIRKMVATPHYIYGETVLVKKDYLEKIAVLNNELSKLDIDIEVLSGNEVYIDPQIYKLLNEDMYCSINNSKYLLIEFPMYDIPRYAEDVIYNLKLEGITPIIAHPERYHKVIDDSSILEKYIELGAKCQTNSGSITGRFGKKVMETAYDLIENGYINVIASDAHSTNSRKPKMSSALQIIKSKYGDEIADKLFNINPLSIINNEEVMDIEPIIRPRHNLIERLFYKLVR